MKEMPNSINFQSSKTDTVGPHYTGVRYNKKSDI